MELRKFAAGCVSAALAIGFALPAQSAYADMMPVQVKVGGPSGLCLNLPNGYAGVGVEVELWTCWGDTNTAEDVDLHADGTLRIKDHCLQAPAVAGPGQASANTVSLQTCGTAGNQRWEYRAAEKSLYNRSTDRCLSGGLSDWQMGLRSTKVATAACASGAPQQTWSIAAWGPITASDGNCFNAPNNWMGDGYPLEVYPCSTSYNHAQVWHYDRVSGQIIGDYNGWKNHNSSLWCVTADNQDLGTVVKFRKCESDPEKNKGQIWEEGPSGTFYNPVSDKCLGVKATTDTGKPLELQECVIP